MRLCNAFKENKIKSLMLILIKGCPERTAFFIEFSCILKEFENVYWKSIPFIHKKSPVKKRD